MAATPARRQGRPSKLHSKVHVKRRNEQGITEDVVVTAAEAVIDRLRSGAPKRETAATVGVTRQTFDNWVKRGVRAHQTLDAGGEITADDRAYIEFADQVEQARAEALLTDWTLMGLIAQGGIETRVVKEKTEVIRDDQGNVIGERVVERVVQSETTLPDYKALAWRMEKGWPGLFPHQVEHTGPAGEPIPVELRVGRLAERLDAIQKARGNVIPISERTESG